MASPIPTKTVPAGKISGYTDRVALIKDNNFADEDIKSRGEFNVETQEYYYKDNPIRPVVCIPKDKITYDMNIDEEKENNSKAKKVIEEFVDGFNNENTEKIKNTINENVYYFIMNLSQKDGEKSKVLWNQLERIENLIENDDKQIYTENDIDEKLEEQFESYLGYKNKKIAINEIQDVGRVEDYWCIYKCQVEMEDNNKYTFILAKLYDEFKIIGIEVNKN